MQNVDGRQRWNNFLLNRQKVRQYEYNAYYGNPQHGQTTPDYNMLDHPNAGEIKSELERLDYYNNLEETDQRGVADKIGDALTGAWNSISDTVTKDIPNAFRYATQKLGSQNVDSDINKIGDLNSEIKDLELIKEYKALHSRLNQIRLLYTENEFYNVYTLNNENNKAEYERIVTRLSQLDEYFKGDGRHHTAIAQLMYNPDNLSALDKTLINGMYAFKDDSTLTGSAVGILDWLSTTLNQGFSNIIGNGSSINGYKTGEVVKRLKEMGYGDGVINHFMDQLYVGSNSNVKQLSTQINDKRIDDWINYNKDLIKENEIDLVNDLEFARSGKFKYYINTKNNGVLGKLINANTTLDLGKIYDPEDLSLEFKDNSEKYVSEWYSAFIHPIYSLPNIASTVGLFKHQLEAMSADAALGMGMNFIAKRFPVLAFATDAVQIIGSTQLGINASVESRKDETGLEKIQAYKERLLTDLIDKGVDVDDVFKQAKDYIQNVLKIDTKNIDDDRILDLAMAYDIPITTRGYNEASQNAKKGIEKLVNLNNALAIHDYLETLPFMSYGGSAMLRGLDRYGSKAVYGKASDLVERQLASTYSAVLGGIVNKLASKMLAKDSPEWIRAGLITKHAGNFLANKLKLAAYEGFMESGEEGAQELIQSRFKRGEYDDYNQATTMFDMDEILNFPGLYSDAVLDYLGLNYGDPDNASENLRKAMNIGFSSSLMFSGGLGFVKNNVFSNEGMFDLYRQLKADNAVGKIIGTYAQEAQDHNHISTFFDSFSKNGKTGPNIIKALNDIKNNVKENNTLVTKSDVEADIKLARAAWNLYTSDFINNELKNNGIKRNSDTHKQLIIDGTTAIVDANMTSDLINDGKTKNKDSVNSHFQLLEDYFNDILTDQERQQILDLNPFFANFIETFKDRYGIFKQVYDQDRSKELKALKDQFSDYSYDDLINNHEFLEYAKKNNIDINNPDFDLNSNIDKFINYLYSNKFRSNLNLDNENSFIRNLHIRLFARSEAGNVRERDIDNILRSAYSDKNERDRIIAGASNNYLNGSVSEDGYLRFFMNVLHFNFEEKATLKALEISKKKLDRLKEIRRRTGLDVNTDRLEGIVNLLLKMHERIQKRNNSIAKGNGNNSVTLQQLLDNDNLQFDDQNEYFENLVTLQLNNAVFVPLAKIASVYMTGTSNDIIGLQQAMYGDNVDESVIKDEVAEYKKMLSRNTKGVDLDSDVSTLDDWANEDDMRKISKSAAWKVIKDKLEQSEKRKLIARRNFSEDTGIPEEILTEDQNNESTQEVDDNDSISLSQSTAEQLFEQSAMHGSGNSKSGLQLLNDARKLRKEDSEKEDNDSQDQEAVDDNQADVEIDNSDEEFDVDDDDVFTYNGNKPEEQDEPDEIVPPGPIVPKDPEIQEMGAEPTTQDNEESDDEFNDYENVDEEDDSVTEVSADDAVNEDTTVLDIIDKKTQEAVELTITDDDIAEYIKENEITQSITNTDLLEYDEEINKWFYDGVELSQDQQRRIEDEMFLLEQAQKMGLTQEELPDSDAMSIQDLRLLANEESVGDLISQTFFYQPNAETPIVLKVAGEEVQFNKPIGTGKLLAKKLLQKNWLSSAKKYYVVSQSEEGLKSLADPRDSMTVTLAIEDNENVYLVTLRQLGVTVSDIEKTKNKFEGEDLYLQMWAKYNEHGIIKDAESDIRMWLESRNVDWSLVDGALNLPNDKYLKRRRQRLLRQAIMNRAKKLAEGQYVSQYKVDNRNYTEDDSVAKANFEKWWNGALNVKGLSEEQLKEKQLKDALEKAYYIEKAKLQFAKPGKYMLTMYQIEQQIQKLRTLRNSIIDSYATVVQDGDNVKYKLPIKPKTTVTPAFVTLSNGRFDTVKNEDGSPKFRSVVNEELTISQIQDKIDSGELQFGVGTGAYGNVEYAIKAFVTGDVSTNFTGRGLSGKIYMFVDSIDGSSRRVPMMLSEELFDYQEHEDGSKVYKNKIQLCLDYDPNLKTYVNTNTDGFKPSAAEVLLYMLCDKIDMGISDYDKRREVVEFFIHNDIKTLLSEQPKYHISPIKPFASKQLYYDRESETLTIALPTGSVVNGKTSYETLTFTKNALFGENSEENRLKVIHAIASQMHWNTDVAHMNNTTSHGSVMEFLSNYVNKEDSQNGVTRTNEDDDIIELFGCPQLSFKISEIKADYGKESTNLAWMIKNKRLKTDVSEDLFYAPFVFAGGVQVKNKQSKQVVDDMNNADAEIINNIGNDAPTALMVDLTKLDYLRSIGATELKVAQTEEEFKSAMEELNDRSDAKANGGFKARLLISPVESSTEQWEQNPVDEFYKLINSAISIYNKNHPKDKIELNSDTDKTSNLTKRKMESYVNGDSFAIINVFNNGNIKITIKRSDDWNETVTGVFKTERSSGKFDEKSAREWLKNKLGLDESNVIVTDAIMKSVADELVFGLTNVCTDVMSDALIGYMILSEQGGSGVTYHEAYHYVSLLMLDLNDRKRVYKSFIKNHKKLNKKGVTLRLVEESLADEFMKYVEALNDNTLSGRIKRYFNNLLDFLSITRRKSEYRNLFKDIQNGRFKNQKLDQESLEEFHTKYKNGVYLKYALPGLTKEEAKNSANIDRYQQYYDAVRSISNKILLTMNPSTPEDLIAYTKEHGRFEDVKDMVQEMMDELDPDEDVGYSILSDLLKNDKFLLRMFKDTLLELGFKTKTKKVKDIETEGVVEDPDAPKKEDEGNSWDKFELTAPKKDNASIRTKIFFRTIPKYRTVLNQDGTPRFIQDIDDFGAEKMWTLDQTWQLVLGELNSATSFADRNEDGSYKKSSIMGKVENLNQVSNFWNALYKRLLNLDNGSNTDSQLKSEIFTTLCSNKNNINLIQIQNPFGGNFDLLDLGIDPMEDLADLDEGSETEYEQDESVESRTRLWTLLGDVALIVARSVPRRWSGYLASKGFINYNAKDGTSTVNEQFVQVVKQKYSNLLKLLSKKVTDTSTFSYKDALYSKDGIINSIIDLLLYIGIPVDIETLNTFITLTSNINEPRELTSKELYDTIVNIFKNTSQGSLHSVIQSIIQSSGQSTIKALGRAKNDRLLDEVFNNYKPSSHIGILAVAYNQHHPNLADYSVKGANGDTYYPINQNNANSSLLRDLHDRSNGKYDAMRRSPYHTASIILDSIGMSNSNNTDTFVKAHTFVGLKDGDRSYGADYLGITDIEDYLVKMYLTEQDHIILPTMADKKGWGSLSPGKIPGANGKTQSTWQLCHDIVLYKVPMKFVNLAIYQQFAERVEQYDPLKYNSVTAYNYAAKKWYQELSDVEKQEIEDVAKSLMGEKDLTGITFQRFSDSTLSKFGKYFISEIDTLIAYYSRENISYRVNNPNKIIENYHGNIFEIERDGKKQKRLDFSGNGGKFRYFYDIIKHKAGIKTINLNQKLEALYELLKKIEGGSAINRSSNNPLFPNVTIDSIQETNSRDEKLELDGFEMIRKELKQMRKNFVNRLGDPNNKLLDSINDWLLDLVEDEMKFVTEPGSTFQLGEVINGRRMSKSIPSQFFERYMKVYRERYLTNNGDDIYENKGINDINDIAFYNLIASHTLNSMISVIETEKIFTGDPAFYKWKKNGDDPNSTITYEHNINVNGQVVTVKEKVTVENLDDTFSDKVKRLGGTQSPGSELRLDFSQVELGKPGNEMLGSTKYTVLDVEDIEIPSPFLQEIEDSFMKQLVVDHVRYSKPKWFEDVIDRTKKQGHNVRDFEHAIDLLYNNEKFYNAVIAAIPKSKLKDLKKMLKKQIAPYEKITVADALVFIRPELYRKIKIGLGEWQWKVVDGYSDEIAYDIIERGMYHGRKLKEGEWLTNPELYSKVKKFQTNALKMSYFQNAAIEEAYGGMLVKPIYNKMAIFPLFKYHRSTSIGRMLYDRMNDSELGEIDMIAFKSAVKVGAVKNGAKLINKVKVRRDDDDESIIKNIEEIKHATSQLTSVLKTASDTKVNYLTDEIISGSSENTLPISVQDLKLLRLQLNTHAHESTERAIGTQMFKIAFSNIIDKALYGTGKSGRKARTGKAIKSDIMRCINKLTDMGVRNVRTRFYKRIKDEAGNVSYVLNRKEIENFVRSSVVSNGLGASAEDIILHGGVVAGLTQRAIFEQSMSSLINSEIVDINTTGGTAIQQSMFGFAAISYDNKSTSRQTDYMSEEDERTAQLIETRLDNTDYLSLRTDVALKALDIYTIKDLIQNKDKIDKAITIDKKIKSELNDLLDDLNLSWDTKTEFKHKVKDEYVQYNDGKELKWMAEEGNMEVLLSMNFFKPVLPSNLKGASYSELRKWLIENDIINGTRSDGTKSNPKPFGIGYRIPTQGMSSMFGFIVADVLPEQVGDLIIVPREFTAQTGSDFDVDKLYLATYSYKDGVRLSESDEEVTAGSIANTLLDNYLDIITDSRNFANARASIDVVTGIVQDDLLRKVLKSKKRGYRKGGSLLLPSFQCKRKQEFKVGKDGIGPFALNITNMSLTQFVHLTMDYGSNEYNLGNLDEIYGEDELRIADWLSAMVNAHVDVAKDAYVFDLNLNLVTYNHANLLLRAGKGKKTFLLLALPLVKRYAGELLNAGGVYGAHIELDSSNSKYENKKKKVMSNLIREAIKDIQDIMRLYSTDLDEDQTTLVKNVIAYYTEYADKLDGKYKKQQDDKQKPVLRIEKKNVIFENEDSLFGVIDSKKGVDSRTENAIINYTSDDFKKKLDSRIIQLYALEAFSDLNKYAEAISQLVQCSAIDTKKFGNNIVSHINYENKMRNFINTATVFTINDPTFIESIPTKFDKDGKPKKPSASDISKAALNKYYEDTFLMKKFKLALKYTRILLDGQTFKSSKAYRSIFYAVCRNIFGASDTTNPDGSTYYGYDNVLKDDVIQAIGNAVDDVMRYNTLASSGYQVYQQLLKTNLDVIDFTMGNDIEAVKNNMSRLLFGEYKTNSVTGELEVVEDSIFNRLSKLIDEIKHNPLNPEYRTLVDRNGNIQNDLLLFLTPVSPSSKFPIGRMILSEPQHTVKGDFKARLIAAFSELLTSTNENIKNIAHDLAFYAYYSTYDQNTRNTFFDLVPSRFRQQYDVALKNTLSSLRSNDETVVMQILNLISRSSNTDDFSSALLSASNAIIDVISRNYSYDDNYVKPFNIDKKSKRDLLFSGTYYTRSVAVNVGEQDFPPFIITTKADSVYIKIRKYGQVLLYKRTGYITQEKDTADGVKTGSTFNVYTAVPNAGLHVGKINQFELYCGYDTLSIFDQNRISKEFAEDVVRQLITEIVDKNNEEAAKAIENKRSEMWRLSTNWTFDEIPVQYTQDNMLLYSEPSIDERTRINNAVFTYVDNANFVSNKQGDVVVNLNNIVAESFGKNIANQHSSKTVSLGLSTGINTVMELIKTLSDGKTESGIKISFSTETYDNQFNVPQSYIDEFINFELQKYKNSSTTQNPITDEMIQKEREFLQQDYGFNKRIKIAYLSEVIDKILTEIEDEIGITSVVTSVGNGKTLLALALANLHSEHTLNYIDSETKILADSQLKSKKTRGFAKHLKEDLLKYFQTVNNTESAQTVEQEIIDEDVDDIEDTEVDFEYSKSNDDEQSKENVIEKIINDANEKLAAASQYNFDDEFDEDVDYGFDYESNDMLKESEKSKENESCEL